MPLKKCKVCFHDKVAVIAGRRKRRGFIWADDSGRRWEGKTCPECLSVKQIQRHRTRRRKAWGLSPDVDISIYRRRDSLGRYLPWSLICGV